MWPYRLITAAFEALRARYASRFSVEANTPVNSIERSAHDGLYDVETPRGIIRAKHVVHCTEGHTAHLLSKLRGILVPRRGQMTVQAITGRPVPVEENVCWNFLFGTSSDYATPNARSGEIWIGGGDVRSEDGAFDYLGVASDTDESIWAKSHLRGVLPTVFAGTGDRYGLDTGADLKASWTGIMCNSLEHVPLVGRLPSEISSDPKAILQSNEWVSAGYGGYGMVNAFLCGRSLARMVMGCQDNDLLPRQYRISRERVARLQSEAKIVTCAIRFSAWKG